MGHVRAMLSSFLNHTEAAIIDISAERGYAYLRLEILKIGYLLFRLIYKQFLALMIEIEMLNIDETLSSRQNIA